MESGLGRPAPNVSGRDNDSRDNDSQPIAWELPLVVSGDSEESDLTVVARREFDERTAGADVHWVESGEDITLAGAITRGQNSWWWLIAGILGLLMIEMLVVATPSLGRSKQP